MTTFDELYHHHVARSLDKQVWLGERIGRHSWAYSMDTGLLTFSGERSLVVASEVLGSVSDADGSWLWAWANAASQIPAKLLAASAALRIMGEQFEMVELSDGELATDQVDPQALAMVACGALGASGYYRGPHAGGAVYLLIRDPAFPTCPEPAIARIAKVFPQITGLGGIHHQRAFLPYLESYGLNADVAGATVCANGAGGSLAATFDSLGRLTKLDVSLAR